MGRIVFGLLFALIVVSRLLLGANSGCELPEGATYDLHLPQQWPAQPVMRTYYVYVDGVRQPTLFWQGSFGTGLSPTQNVEVCWSSCGTVIPRGEPECPEYWPFGNPALRDTDPCIKGCEHWDDEPIECFAPRWYQTGVDVRTMRRFAAPGGPRWDVRTGEYMGYR